MSGSISYMRQFSHKDWIDFVDSVQAGGANGINGRLHGVEAEFDKISTVISLIASALQTPVVKNRTITLSPTLGGTVEIPWTQMIGWVTTTTIQSTPQLMSTIANGFMPVSLPDGATIKGLRVVGSSAGGSLNVTLQSQAINSGNFVPVVTVANVFPSVASAVPFDLPPAPQNISTVVNNATTKYFITAALNNGNGTLSAGGTSLNVFQISYASS